ncbi:MAG: type II toxin-antitoxin system VapC family toxin [Anaerolineae bacterium]
MPAYYLDSSALVKRYVTEIGSVWVRGLCQEPANAVFISELALVEVGSAFARRCRRGEISDEERRNYLAVFVHDCAEGYYLIPVEWPTIVRALDLTQTHSLCGYDALQLACALAAKDVLVSSGLPALTFVTADDGLLASAGAEGLPAENPNRH